jgi:nitrite reductase/ring-hydroxylating ferredoxin subunit
MVTPTASSYRTLGEAADLPENYANPYYLPDLKRRICVARSDGQLFAFDDLCPHDRCPLSAGLLRRTSIMCQGDSSSFDLATGAVLNGPAAKPLRTYQVREQGGELQIAI